MIAILAIASSRRLEWVTERVVHVCFIHVNHDIPFPHNLLNSFLSNSANKNNIGFYLAKKLVSVHAECGNTLLQLCVPYEDRTISTTALLDTSMVDSTAEETDQKLVRHTFHCIREKYTVIDPQSIDTDVLVILLAYVAMELESTNIHSMCSSRWFH